MTHDFLVTGGPEASIENPVPRIYTVNEILIRPEDDPKYIETKDHKFRTKVLLPVELNSVKHYLGLIPILTKENQTVGYMFWYDPRDEGLAFDTTQDVIKIGKRVAPKASLGLIIESGKSRKMCKAVATGLGIVEGRIEEFAKCSVEEAMEIMRDPSKGEATLYTKITSGDQINGMKLSPEQVQVIAATPLDEIVEIDDISSTGGTGKGEEEAVNKCKIRVGEGPEKVTKIVGGIEVPSEMLIEGWEPPEDVHAAFVFPVIKGSIIRTQNHGELDLSELAGIIQ